ncbi:grpb/dephospho-CoA kinase [Lipomyces kononenkoae]
MPATVAQILAPYEYKPELVERIASRTVTPPITIVEPNPEWPQRFEQVKERIQNALGPLILDIAHAGSTSVPGLPAKDIIDVDLSLKDGMDEPSYVKSLEQAGFKFLLREPRWHQHRFFVENWPNAYHVNVHVWGPDSPEVARHRIFRDWLLKAPADLELYAKVKREAAEQTAVAGDSVMDYNQRKEKTIREILARAFRDLGYIE